MSRVVTPSSNQGGTSSSSSGLSQEKIAQRAYEKWCKRGRPNGTDRQDWLEAEAELRQEAARGSSSSSSSNRR